MKSQYQGFATIREFTVQVESKPVDTHELKVVGKAVKKKGVINVSVDW